MCNFTDFRKTHFPIAYFPEIMFLVASANRDKVISTGIVMKIGPWRFALLDILDGRTGVRFFAGFGRTGVRPYIVIHIHLLVKPIVHADVEKCPTGDWWSRWGGWFSRYGLQQCHLAASGCGADDVEARSEGHGGAGHIGGNICHDTAHSVDDRKGAAVLRQNEGAAVRNH